MLCVGLAACGGTAQHEKACEVGVIGWKESATATYASPKDIPLTTKYKTTYAAATTSAPARLTIEVKKGEATQFAFIARDAFGDTYDKTATTTLAVKDNATSAAPTGFTKNTATAETFDKPGTTLSMNYLYLPAEKTLLGDNATTHGLNYAAEGSYTLTYTHNTVSFEVVLKIIK